MHNTSCLHDKLSVASQKLQEIYPWLVYGHDMSNPSIIFALMCEWWFVPSEPLLVKKAATKLQVEINSYILDGSIPKWFIEASEHLYGVDESTMSAHRRCKPTVHLLGS